MKPTSKLFIISIVLSLLQIYVSYLLHNDKIHFFLFQWIISIFYIPLYFVLFMIGELSESLFHLNLYKGGYMFPYLKDIVWAIGFIIILPLNFIFIRWVYNRKRK